MSLYHVDDGIFVGICYGQFLDNYNYLDPRKHASSPWRAAEVVRRLDGVVKSLRKFGEKTKTCRDCEIIARGLLTAGRKCERAGNSELQAQAIRERVIEICYPNRRKFVLGVRTDF